MLVGGGVWWGASIVSEDISILQRCVTPCHLLMVGAITQIETWSPPKALNSLSMFACQGLEDKLCVTLMGFIFLKTAISKVYQLLVLFLYWFSPIWAIFM